MSYFKTLTGSEPDEEAVTASVNKALTISLYYNGAPAVNTDYTIGWQVVNGTGKNAKPALDADGQPYDVSGNEASKSAKWDGEHDTTLNATNVAEFDEGDIDIVVNTDKDLASYVRVYIAKKDGANEVVAVSANSTTGTVGDRFDFPNGEEYFDFQMGTEDAPKKVNLELKKLDKDGKFMFAWKAGNNTDYTALDEDGVQLSYNEIKSDGSTYPEVLLNNDGSGNYVFSGKIVSGNKIQVSKINYKDTATDRTYFYAGKYQYPKKNGETATVTSALPVKVDPVGEYATDLGAEEYTLLMNRYLLATVDGGTLSDDNVFKPAQVSGFPVLSINQILTSNIDSEPSAAFKETNCVKDNKGDTVDGIFFNDIDKLGSADVEYVVLKTWFQNPDEANTYTLEGAKVGGEDCVVVDDNSSDKIKFNNVWYTIKVPKSAIKKAFENDPLLKSLDITLDMKKTPVFVGVSGATNAGYPGQVDPDSASMQTMKIVLDGEKNARWTGSTVPAASRKFNYGDKGSLILVPKEGYEVVSANVVTYTFENGARKKVENNFDGNALAAGAPITLNIDTVIKVYVKKSYGYKVYYTAGSEEIKGKDGKYTVHYKKPAYIEMLNGTTPVQITSLNAISGGSEIYRSASGIDINGSGKITIDGTKLSGNTITLKFTSTPYPNTPTTAEELAKCEDLQTAEITIEGADGKTVTLKDKKIEKNGDTFPLGAVRYYYVDVKGIDFDRLGARVSKSAEGVTASMEKDKNNNVYIRLATTASTPADYAADVEVYDLYDTTNVFCKVGVKTETTTVAMSNAFTAKVTGKTNNTIGLNFALNKKISSFFMDNDNPYGINGLYYLVDVKGDKAPKSSHIKQNTTVLVSANQTSYIVDLKQNCTQASDFYEGDDSVTYTITVKLVQTKAPQNMPSAWDGSNKIVENTTSSTLTTKLGAGQNFATSVKLKANGAAKKLYSNMKEEAGYSIGVTYNSGCGVQRLDEVSLYRYIKTTNSWTHCATATLGGAVESATGTGTYGNVLKATNNKIVLAPFNHGLTWIPAGKYRIEAYAVEPAGYEVCGKFDFNVVEAIQGLEVKADNSTIIVPAANKGASANLNVYDQNGKISKKVTYTVVDGTAAINKDDEKTWTKDFAIIPYISVKSGKITIKKGCPINKDPEKNAFYVIVKANDYKGNWVTEKSEKIYVANMPSTSLFITNEKTTGGAKDQKNTPKGSVGAAYEISEFFYDKNDAAERTTLNGEGIYDDFGYGGAAISSKDYRKYRYFAILKVYDNKKTPEEVAFKFGVGGAKVLKYNPVYARNNDVRNSVIIATNKPVKITVKGTAQDGSKRNKFVNGSNKVVIDTTYNNDETGYILEGFDSFKNGATFKIVSSNEAKLIQINKNYAPAGKALTLTVFGFKKGTDLTDAAKLDEAKKQLINCTVKADGAKVKPQSEGVWSIIPESKYVDVTITRSVGKTKVPVKFRFENPSITDKKKSPKAPAIKVSGTNYASGKTYTGTTAKIYNDIEFYGGYGSGNGKIQPNKVTYAVDFSKLNISGTKQVMVNVDKDDFDHDLNNVAAALASAANPKFGNGVAKSFYVVDLSKDNTFEIDFNTSGTAGNAKFFVNKGTYTITITPGFTKDDVFQATGKAVTAKINASAAPKANVKPAATLDFNGGKTAVLDFSKAKNYFNDGSGKAKIGIKAGDELGLIYLKGVNTKGTINHFQTAFSITDGKTVTFKGTTGCETIDPKKDKTELNGWVGYSYRGLDGKDSGIQWTKVKIKSSAPITNK